MISEKFKQAIMFISEVLSNAKIKWAVIGSTNQALQGMEITPNDLDLIVSFDYLKKIPELFKSFSPSPFQKLETTTGMPAWDVKMTLKKVEVQFLGERKEGLYVKPLLSKKVTHVTVNGLSIPCLALDSEANAYAKTNREKKAKAILDFLAKQ